MTFNASIGCLLLCALTGSGCTRAQWTTVRPFAHAPIGVQVPARYEMTRVWSPDSDIVRFADPVSSTEIFVEFGTSGWPDYRRQEGYRAEAVTVDGIEGEVVEFIDPDRPDAPVRVVLRFPAVDYARLWANTTAERRNTVRRVFARLRWQADGEAE